MATLEWLKPHMPKLPPFILRNKRILYLVFLLNVSSRTLLLDQLVICYTLDAQRSQCLVIKSLSLREGLQGLGWAVPFLRCMMMGMSPSFSSSFICKIEITLELSERSVFKEEKNHITAPNPWKIPKAQIIHFLKLIIHTFIKIVLQAKHHAIDLEWGWIYQPMMWENQSQFERETQNQITWIYYHASYSSCV